LQQKQAEADKISNKLGQLHKNKEIVIRQLNIFNNMPHPHNKMTMRTISALNNIKNSIDIARTQLEGNLNGLKNEINRLGQPVDQRSESYAQEYEQKTAELEDLKFTEEISAPTKTGERLTMDAQIRKKQLEKWFEDTGKYTPDQYTIVTQLQEVGVTEERFLKEGLTIPRFTSDKYKDISFDSVSFDPKKQSYKDVAQIIADRNVEIGMAVATRDFTVTDEVPEIYSEFITVPPRYASMNVSETEYEKVAYQYSVLKTMSDKDFFDWRTQKGVEYYDATNKFPFFFDPDAHAPEEGTKIPDEKWDKLAFESIYKELTDEEKKERLEELMLPEWRDTYNKYLTDVPVSFKIIFQKPTTDEWKDVSEDMFDKIKYHQIVGDLSLEKAKDRAKKNNNNRSASFRYLYLC